MIDKFHYAAALTFIFIVGIALHESTHLIEGGTSDFKSICIAGYIDQDPAGLGWVEWHKNRDIGESGPYTVQFLFYLLAYSWYFRIKMWKMIQEVKK